MICPRCLDTVLHRRTVRDLSLGLCPRCHGVWLDRGALEQLRARRLDPEVAAAVSRGAAHPEDRGWRPDLVFDSDFVGGLEADLVPQRDPRRDRHRHREAKRAGALFEHFG